MTAVLRCSLIPDSLSATPAERATPQATSTTESKTTARAADATGQLITNITIRLARGTAMAAAISGMAWDKPSSSCSTSSCNTFLR